MLRESIGSGEVQHLQYETFAKVDAKLTHLTSLPDPYLGSDVQVVEQEVQALLDAFGKASVRVKLL
jgi:hypothetical protein